MLGINSKRFGNFFKIYFTEIQMQNTVADPHPSVVDPDLGKNLDAEPDP